MNNIQTKRIHLKDEVVINVFENDYIGKIVEKTNDYYERTELDMLRKYIPQNAVIYDIGANIGNHTLFFSKYACPNKIFCFEPIPHVFEVLVKNIHDNKFSNIEAFNMAVSDTNTTGNMLINDHNVGASQLSLQDSGSTKVIQLDHFNLLPPDFIKIDVEDSEYFVIKGMENLLKSNHPIIWVEIRDETFPRVHEQLQDLGYKMVDRVPNKDIYSNFIYMHNEEIHKQNIETNSLYSYHNEVTQQKTTIRNYTNAIMQLQQEIKHRQDLLEQASALLNRYKSYNEQLQTENNNLKSQLKK